MRTPEKVWPRDVSYNGFYAGDRVQIVSTGYVLDRMQGAYGRVCAFRRDDAELIGVLLDDPIGYDHDCEGYGVDGYSVWIPYYDVELIDHDEEIVLEESVMSFLS